MFGISVPRGFADAVTNSIGAAIPGGFGFGTPGNVHQAMPNIPQAMGNYAAQAGTNAANALVGAFGGQAAPQASTPQRAPALQNISHDIINRAGAAAVHQRPQNAEAYFRPQTAQGRLAAAAGTGVGGALAMPGAVVPNMITGAVSGLAGQGTNELLQPMEGQHPWIKNIEGPASTMASLLAGATTSAITPTVLQRWMGSGTNPGAKPLSEATAGVTPDQLQSAAQLGQTAQGMGAPLTLSDAVQSQAPFARVNQLQRSVESSPQGVPLRQMFADRPAQGSAMVNALLDNIAPQGTDPALLGSQGQEAATGALRQLEASRTAATSPLYQQANPVQIDPQDIQGLVNNLTQAAGTDSTGLIAPELTKFRDLLQARPPLIQEGGSGTFFHGSTTNGLTSFDPTKQSGTFDFPPVVSASTSPGVARQYAGPDGSVYPVNVYANRLGDFRNNSDVNAASQFYKDSGTQLDSNDLAALQHGSWRLWENPALWKRMGWDGSYVREEPGTTGAGAQHINISLGDGNLVRPFGAPPPMPSPITDVGNLSRALKFTQERMSLPPGSTGAIGRQTAGMLGPHLDQLDSLLSQVPSYDQANSLYRDLSQSTVNPGMNGPLGTIQNATNPADQGAALYPSQPVEGQPANTTQAIGRLQAQSPGLPADITRAYLARALNEQTQDNIPGANEWGGPKFAANVQGNPLQAQTLQAGIGAVAPNAVPQYNDTMDVLGAMGTRLRPGSETFEKLQQAGQVPHGIVPMVLGPLKKMLMQGQSDASNKYILNALMADPSQWEGLVQKAQTQAAQDAMAQRALRGAAIGGLGAAANQAQQ